MKTHNIYAAKPELLEALRKVLPAGVDVNEHGWVTKPIHYKMVSRIRLAVARSIFGKPFKTSKSLERFFEDIRNNAPDNPHGTRWDPSS